MDISWIRFKTVVLFGAKQTDGRNFYTGNNISLYIVCHAKFIVLEIVDISIVL